MHFSPGSVVAEIQVVLYDHPDAEGIFNASFSDLDLANIYPLWSVELFLDRTCK